MKKRSKTLLSVVLCVCLSFCALPVRAADAPLTLTVTADTHYQCEADLGEPSDVYTENMLDPALYGYASTQGQMPYESEAIVRQMLDQFAASASPVLLIAGDLTCGRRQSHLRFAQMLRDTEQKSGKRIFVIIGNHDCEAESTADRISMAEFCEIYADFGYNEARTRHDGSASYTADLSDDVRLLAIDSCIYGEDEGEIRRDVFKWIKAQTDAAEKDGKTLIAMMHHSLLPHYALQPMIRRYRTYASWFADHGIGVVLTGHIHANDIASAVSDRGNTVYDVQTGALIASPNAYRELTVQDGTVEIRTQYVTQIDTSYLSSYLTDEQKSKLEADFPAYAHDYFVSGVCKWINRNLGSVNRPARWFKLREGTAPYKTAERIMQRLGSAIGQDIYDTGSGGSIEAALAPFGIRVPESGYTKPYEAVANVMYGFFHGDEATVSSDEDVQLLLTCIQGALVTAMLPENNDALRSLCTAVTGKTAGMKTATLRRDVSRAMALALFETLAAGFTDDYSDPADLDVTLTFRESGRTTPLHFLTLLLRFLEDYRDQLLCRLRQGK